MKGILGAILIGLSIAFIHSNREDWWILYAGLFTMFGGLELFISDKIERAISELKNE